MPFCFSPWTNIDISPMGEIAPCCKFRSKYYDQKFNIQNHTLQEYKNSELVNSVKKEFLSGNWPKGCERCRIEEENNISSKRQLDWDRWKQFYDNYDLDNNQFITASIAFGNTCNLKCITCGPHSSSRWHKEFKEIYGVTMDHFKFYKNNFVQEFVTDAPHIVHLDIPGGEPFLSGVDEQKDLLQHYISQGQAKHISLHYTTNVTVFPDNQWWKLWEHFREIDLQLSIDAVGARYEYIRYPANWDQTMANTKHYLEKQKTCGNLRLSVSHTVSAYNIYYLDEFFDWCYTTGLPRPWCGRVHTPSHMQPEVWPPETKLFIMHKLQQSDDPDVKDWAKSLMQHDQSEHFEEFKSRTQQHDAYRNLNFTETFPEMAKWIR
jgi:MoaA/NifB/PqqE/SkfB family radical SAM enzyme